MVVPNSVLTIIGIPLKYCQVEIIPQFYIIVLTFF